MSDENVTGLPRDITAGVVPVPVPAAAGTREFEFDEAQNGIFRELGNTMTFVGTALMLFGAIAGLGGLVTLATKGDAGLGGLVQGAAYVAIGLWTRRAAAAIGRIAATQGRDIAYLMEAMTELKRVYTLQRALIVIGIIFVTLALVFAAMMAAGQ